MDEQVYQQQVNWTINWNNEEQKQWLAIASFVLALLWFNILWLIFWIIALNKKQLKRAALCWVIISAVKLVLSIFILLWILAGALIPRMSVAHERARDMARKSDLNYISTALVSYSYSSDNQNFPEAQNWCVREIMDTLALDSNIDDPLSTSFQPWLFCNSDRLWYGYWTNWQNFVVSASVEYQSNANLCKTPSNDFVTNFKNALNENNIESANEILKNIWDSCAATGSSNLYYVILY